MNERSSPDIDTLRDNIRTWEETIAVQPTSNLVIARSFADETLKFLKHLRASLQSAPDAAARASEPANVDVLIQRLRAADAGGLRIQTYQSLCGDGADALSRLTSVAQPTAGLSDEWCDAFLKATGEWIEAHEPEMECGVPMECEITQEFADELNADARKQIRKGYAAALSISSTDRPHGNPEKEERERLDRWGIGK